MRYPVLFLLSLFLLACNKNNNNTASNGALSATVGGAGYQGTTTLGAYSSSLGLLVIVSYSMQPKDTSAFQIVMPYAPPVNKTLVSDSLSLTYSAKGTEYDALSSKGQLNLVVTSLDGVGHKIAGTFSAIAHDTTNYNDSIIITNGKFNCPFNVNP